MPAIDRRNWREIGRAASSSVPLTSGLLTNHEPPNKGMKLTKLSAAPPCAASGAPGGAASCPRRRQDAGTASQLIPGVRRTSGVRGSP